MPPVVAASLAGAGDGATLPFTAREFRDAMGQFATGVVVISTEVEGDAHAMTANAFMSGSLEPPLVLVSVACTARMHEKIRSAQHFGVSVLAQDQLQVSSHFAGRPVEGFRPDFDRLQGLPVIRGAAVHVAARLEHAYPCGDHTLYVGRVLALRGQSEKPPPLLYHGGRYAAAQPMSC
jgi:flavin reductase (DIM6/NTAB) family NADH-FMN oxidoreductase RutF